MKALPDLRGTEYGRLLVKEPAVRRKYWVCLCSCGKVIEVRYDHLQAGSSKSCGCLRKELGSLRRTHGMDNTPEYRAWAAMKSRCTDSANPAYKDYGGRGIMVAARWEKFENFYADMGPRPSPKHSIERVDNERGYEPGNCVWATAKAQARNRRNSKLLTFSGRTQTLAAWAEELGISYQTLYSRKSRGLPPEIILDVRRK